ncbi:MAG: metallophosphoesterase family protein [bacterium]
MTIMILADLHMNSMHHIYDLKKKVIDSVPLNEIDAIIICGDIFESNFNCNPYKQLSSIFNDTTTICCLGNHEFVSKTVEEVKNTYKKFYNPKKYNVHYLDIIGHYDIDGYRFIGNVLWYDGETKTNKDQNLDNFANGRWIDKYILNFNWKRENEKCVEQIEENFDKNKINILCTHHVPHISLNKHIEENPGSVFNAYSGMKNLFDIVSPAYSFCGHTHRRVFRKVIEGTVCYNVGNDYGDFLHFILDI